MADQPPALATATSSKTPETIGSALMKPENIARIAAVVPKFMTPERMLRVASQAVAKTKHLDEVPFVQLLGGIMVLASLGLEPNTLLGHAYLIPFSTRVKRGNNWEDAYELQVIIGYKGYLELMRRTGIVVNVHADVVYEGDEFSFEYGSEQHLRHKPKGSRAGRKRTYAYAHAKLKDGEAFEALPYDEVLVIRNSAQGYQAALRTKGYAEDEKDAKKKERLTRSWQSAPWIKHEHEMAAKTMVRRLAKMMPMSIEIMNSMEIDGAIDQGRAIDYGKMIDLTAGSTIDLGVDHSDDAVTIEHQPGDQVGQVDQQAEPEKTKEPAAKKTEPKKPAEPAKQELAKAEPAKKAAEPEKPKAAAAPSFV